MRNYDDEILTKVIIVGDSNVGKTCLLRKYVLPDVDVTTVKPTIGVDFLGKIVKIKETIIKFQIWDTAGMERFACIDRAYFRNAGYIIYVYDLTNQKSFDNLKKWIKKEENATEDQEKKPLRILVGNKTDLKTEQVVDDFKAQKFNSKNNFKAFKRTSAYTGYNLDNLFNVIAEDIVHNLELTNYKKKKKSVMEEYDFEGIQVIELPSYSDTEHIDMFAQNKKTTYCSC